MRDGEKEGGECVTVSNVYLAFLELYALSVCENHLNWTRPMKSSTVRSKAVEIDALLLKLVKHSIRTNESVMYVLIVYPQPY